MKLDGCHQFQVEDCFNQLEAAALEEAVALAEVVAQEEAVQEVVAAAQEEVVAALEVAAQVEEVKVIVAQQIMYHPPLKKKLIASFAIS